MRKVSITERPTPRATLKPPWPEGISDGLVLPCGLRGNVPSFDWTTDDETWHRVSPPLHRRGVICLPCFDQLAAEAGVTHNYIVRVQFTGTGRTFDLGQPGQVYHWNEYRRGKD